jgi:thiol-disulfide isomerase/thioredoxin
MHSSRILRLLAAAALSAASFGPIACDAPSAAQSAATSITVEPATLDMGDLVPEVTVTKRVKLTNRSDKPIRVTNSVADCSCTTPTHPAEPIAPGASVETDISIKAGPKQGVTLTKRVTFMLENGELAFLTVVGKVGLFVEQSTDLMRAPSDDVATPGTETITLRGADSTPFAVKAVDPAVCTPATADAAMEHTLTVDWSKWREAGKPTKITILTDHPKTPELVVMVRRTVGQAAKPATAAATAAKPALPPATLTIAPAEGRRIRQYKVELPTVFPGATVPFPPLGKFLKGAEVRGFQPDRVLVIEFFSTTCGHCKEAKPQVEALFEAYGPKGFDFIAVTSEDEAKVSEWLKKPENTEGLAWSIALDPGLAVQKALQNPTFQVSNPRMFVVKNGTVLWYGHPEQAEGPFSQIAAGTWDPATVKDEFVKNALVNRARDNATQQTKQCEKDGNWQPLLTLFEAIAVALPDSASTFEVQRFGTMIGPANMPVEGYAYGRKLVAHYAQDIATLRSIARTTLNSPSVQVRDLDFAFDLAKQADALGKGEDARAAEVLALAYFSKGDRDTAIACQERAIRLQTNAKMKIEYEKLLAKYRKDEPKPVPYTPRPNVTANKPAAPAGAGTSSSADGSEPH